MVVLGGRCPAGVRWGALMSCILVSDSDEVDGRGIGAAITQWDSAGRPSRAVRGRTGSGRGRGAEVTPTCRQRGVSREIYAINANVTRQRAMTPLLPTPLDENAAAQWRI